MTHMIMYLLVASLPMHHYCGPHPQAVKSVSLGA